MVRAGITFWVRYSVGVKARIAIFLIVRLHANKLCLILFVGHVLLT